MPKRDLFQLINNHMQYCLEKIKTINFKTEVPVYAILLSSKYEIIDEGFNFNNSHAEEIIINKNNCKDLSILVTLEPCPACAFKIYTSGIKNIFFGAYNEQYGACGGSFNLFQKIKNYRIINVYGGIMRQENEEYLKNFFKTLRIK